MRLADSMRAGDGFQVIHFAWPIYLAIKFTMKCTFPGTGVTIFPPMQIHTHTKYYVAVTGKQQGTTWIMHTLTNSFFNVR